MTIKKANLKTARGREREKKKEKTRLKSADDI